MRFDDTWDTERVLDAYSIRDDEARFDRVATMTIVCTDIVGGARLFEALPLDDFMALLAGYLDEVRAHFGPRRIIHTLRDDIFIGFEGLDPEALALARGFVGRMLRAAGGPSFECSVGIAAGDVSIITRGDAVECQGAPVAVAKGLAKIARGRGIFVDAWTAEALGATGLTAPASVLLPHVGRPQRVMEVIGAEGALGMKPRFSGAPLRTEWIAAGVERPLA